MRSRREIYVGRIILLAFAGLIFVWPLVAAAIFLAWLIYIIGSAYYYQSYLGHGLERDLGFRLGAYVPRIGLLGPQRMLAIRDVQLDGVFGQAGFQDWDLVPDFSFTELFKLLHRNRGRSVELAVLGGNGEVPVAERPRRVIRFIVPVAA